VFFSEHSVHTHYYKQLRSESTRNIPLSNKYCKTLF